MEYIEARGTAAPEALRLSFMSRAACGCARVIASLLVWYRESPSITGSLLRRLPTSLPATDSTSLLVRRRGLLAEEPMLLRLLARLLPLLGGTLGSFLPRFDVTGSKY